MQYRVNPKNGERISALGLGCMRFPGALGRPDQRQARDIISRAVERGINYLDTAYLYPGNEACVGAALEELGVRDRVLVATKLPHGSVRGAPDLDRILDEQLRRLRTDYVDYYLIHNVTSPGQWDRLRELGIEGWVARQRDAGRIGRSASPITAAPGTFPSSWMPMTGTSARSSTTTSERATRRGRRAFARPPRAASPCSSWSRCWADVWRIACPTGPGASSTTPPSPGSRRRPPGGSPGSGPSEVTMLLSGMAAPEQVDENAAIAERALPGSLTPAQHEVVARVVAEFERANRVRCTGCNYCMPCPQGINIPGSFSAYNASYAHGWFSGAWQYYAASAVRTSEPKLVSNCVRCGACARKCPQHIDIPARLADVGRRFQPGPVGWALKAWSRLR